MTNIKQTHSVKDLEGLISEKLAILVNGESKEEKRKARKEIIMLEKLIKDVDYKLKNGKKYPERMYHSDDKPMNKKELHKLIDSVGTEHEKIAIMVPCDCEELDLSGVSPGENRFTFKEKGSVQTSILDTYNKAKQ